MPGELGGGRKGPNTGAQIFDSSLYHYVPIVPANQDLAQYCDALMVDTDGAKVAFEPYDGIVTVMSGGTQATLVNGNFTITSGTIANVGWVTGTYWSIFNGSGSHRTGDINEIGQTGICSPWATYYTVYDVTARTAGSVTPKIGIVSGTTRSSNGTYAEFITSNNAGNASAVNFAFVPTTDYNGGLDNVSLYPTTPPLIAGTAFPVHAKKIVAVTTGTVYAGFLRRSSIVGY